MLTKVDVDSVLEYGSLQAVKLGVVPLSDIERLPAKERVKLIQDGVFDAVEAVDAGYIKPNYAEDILLMLEYKYFTYGMLTMLRRSMDSSLSLRTCLNCKDLDGNALSIMATVESLPSRYRQTLVERFGLERHTLSVREMSKSWNLSQQRINQNIKSALRKLKHPSMLGKMYYIWFKCSDK